MEDGDIAEVITRMARDFARRRERREEAYKYGRREFDLWVSSAKAPRSAMEALREFDLRFSQLSARDRESVGADKVALFLKSVNERGRVAIFPYLEDDEGAYGLTEDWNVVEWACIQCDARRSATTRLASGGEERAATDYALPPQESSTQIGSDELDIEALIREACGLVKAKIKAEEGLIAETGPSGSEDAEEGASLHIEDGAYAEADREWYIGTTGEGAERATISTCGERTAMDEAGSYGFGTWRPESSKEEETSGGAATFHTPVQETPAAGPSARVRPREKNGGGGKAGNRDNGKETTKEEAASITDAYIDGGEVATGITSTNGGPASLHASSQETAAAGPSARVRPMVKGGGGGKAGDHGVDTREGVEQATLSSRGKRTAMDEADTYGAMDATSRVGGSFGTRLPETFYEDFASILEACEMEEEDETSGDVATFHTPALEASAVGPSAGTRPRATDGGGGKAGKRDDAENGEEEVVASILEACGIGDGGAADNDVRTKAATETTSGGAGSLPTPILEAPMAGPSAGMRLSATGGDGGKAGIRNDDDEDWCGRRQDPSTPGPETTAVVPECRHKTVEKGGGHEEAWPGESTCEEGDAGPERAHTGGPTKRTGTATRRESGTDPTGRRSGRRAKRGPVNRARTEASDSLPAGYGYDGSR